MEPAVQRPPRDRMRTAAATLGAFGLGALYLGYIEVLGSASVVIHVAMLLLATGGLIAVACALAADSRHRASALLLALAAAGVLGLVLVAAWLRLQGLPYAAVAAALLLLAALVEHWA
ncbi:MAG TPA: hypothetical protein VK066_32180 [Chloroflexota bacterium]|nr:hypothetical protein [Chloroflexota bacterium]